MQPATNDTGIFSSDYITNAVVADVKTHDRSKPLLLYINYYAPHTPAQAPATDIVRVALPGRASHEPRACML